MFGESTCSHLSSEERCRGQRALASRSLQWRAACGETLVARCEDSQQVFLVKFWCGWGVNLYGKTTWRCFACWYMGICMSMYLCKLIEFDWYRYQTHSQTPKKRMAGGTAVPAFQLKLLHASRKLKQKLPDKSSPCLKLQAKRTWTI